MPGYPQYNFAIMFGLAYYCYSYSHYNLFSDSILFGMQSSKIKRYEAKLGQKRINANPNYAKTIHAKPKLLFFLIHIENGYSLIVKNYQQTWLYAKSQLRL